MNIKVVLLIVLYSISGLALALDPALKAVVSLHLSDTENPKYDFFCSGVLVAPDKVLTTGHCIEVMATQVYSQWNIFSYEPEKLKVKVVGVKHAVKDVIIAPSYFEAVGLEGEDLALIKLKTPITSVKPLKIAPLSGLKKKQLVSLVARGRVAETSIRAIKKYPSSTAIFIDASVAHVCRGDSGGALLVKSGAEFLLAGILSAQVDGCEKRTGVAVFPRMLK